MAGFDPARFWKITPRLLMIELRGAEEKMQLKRSLVWWGAMLPHVKKPPGHDEFTGARRNKSTDLAACVAAWDRIDRALSAKRGIR